MEPGMGKRALSGCLGRFTYDTTCRKRETAVKAVQALTIFGGVAREVFAIQVQGANMIRRYIVEELHGQFTGNMNTVNQLEFAHSVFTKVRRHLLEHTQSTNWTLM